MPLDSIGKTATIEPNLNNQIYDGPKAALRPMPRAQAMKGVFSMVRPAAKELTQRELEVMHVFWSGGTAGQSTVAAVRERLAAAGRKLAYTTVATLVRILAEKGFLEQTNAERPFQYRPVRSFEEVSRSILGDLVERVFHGSREQLLVRLLAERRLSAKERAVLEAILGE